MKKVTMFMFAITVAFAVNAQQNVAKIGVGSILNSTINLEYERVLNDNSSVLGEIGIGIPADIGDAVFTATGVDGTTAEGITVTEGKASSFYFVGEYRYYTKGEGARGFYVAPYLKFSNYSFDITGEYNNTASGISDIPAEINTNMFVATIGAGIGYQWLINDKFAINWNIVGLGASLNTVNAEFSAADNDVFEEWESEVRAFLDEIPSGSNIDLSSNNETRTIEGTGGFFFPNVRVGVSLGYAF
jgi:hypothetical protein